VKPQLTQQNRTQLYFSYFMDCQTPQKPGGGPDQTWEVAEASVRGIVDLFEEEGLIHGLGLCSEPEVAARQPELFGEMARRGAWQALHFQVRGYRPPGATQDYDWERPLSFYDYDEQREVLSLAKGHWEQALGRKAEDYGACCNMANDWTFPILAELGFRQCYVSGPGRYNPDPRIGHFWWGAYTFSHHASSKCRLVPGELELYEVTITCELTQREAAPGVWVRGDYRPELECDYETTKGMAEAWVRDMLRRGHPVLYLLAATHNTWDVGDRTSPRRRALETTIRVSRDLADQLGLELVPASLADIHAEADRLNAF
jgi:hypothetical protein